MYIITTTYTCKKIIEMKFPLQSQWNTGDSLKWYDCALGHD